MGLYNTAGRTKARLGGARPDRFEVAVDSYKARCGDLPTLSRGFVAPVEGEYRGNLRPIRGELNRFTFDI